MSLAVANVEASSTDNAGDRCTVAGSVVILARGLALQVTALDDERSEPADHRHAAKCIEIASQTTGAKRLGVHRQLSQQRQNNEKSTYVHGT